MSHGTVTDALEALRALGGRGAAALGILLLFLAAFPSMGSPYAVSLLLSVSMYVVLSASWNIISGFAGYVSFGHVVFWGMGAYLTAILVNHGFLWPVALLAGGLGASLLGLLIAYPVLRLSGVYFGISMLAFAEAVSIVVSYLKGITGGGGGIYLVPVISLNCSYYLMSGLAFAVVLFTYLLRNSKFGWSLVAIRENEAAAESLSVNTTLCKVGAFLMSAFFTGVAGGIYVMNVCFIDPKTAFDIGITLRVIMMTMFGGIGTVMGPVVGPAAFSALSEFLWAKFPFIHKAVLGLLIIVIVLAIPRGIVPFLSRYGRHGGRRHSRSEVTTA